MMLLKVAYRNSCGEVLCRYIVAESPRIVFDFWEKDKRAPIKSVEILDRNIETITGGND